MTDTSKAVERYSPDVINRGVWIYAIMEQDLQGDYVTYKDYTALSAQLAEANARADRARDDALWDVLAWLRNHSDRIDEPTEWLCDQLIQALRTQPTASVEPVTVQKCPHCAHRIALHISNLKSMGARP